MLRDRSPARGAAPRWQRAGNATAPARSAPPLPLLALRRSRCDGPLCPHLAAPQVAPPPRRARPQDKTLLSAPQRLSLWYVLWAAFKGGRLGDHPFVSLFIEVRGAAPLHLYCILCFLPAATPAVPTMDQRHAALQQLRAYPVYRGARSPALCSLCLSRLQLSQLSQHCVDLWCVQLFSIGPKAYMQHCRSCTPTRPPRRVPIRAAGSGRALTLPTRPRPRPQAAADAAAPPPERCLLLQLLQGGGLEPLARLTLQTFAVSAEALAAAPAPDVAALRRQYLDG